MSALEAAKIALKVISEGRAALARVTDSVRDGTLAITETDQAELNRMLAEEAQETRAAYDALDAALRAKGA